jgi:hypothetical protein
VIRPIRIDSPPVAYIPTRSCEKGSQPSTLVMRLAQSGSQEAAVGGICQLRTLGSNRSVTMGTPYVFRDGDRHTWESFFQRYLSSEFGAGHSLRDYLKYGKSLGYWLEFVFQGFAGYTGNMILVTGVPDDAASLPHSSPKHKL